MRRKEIEERRKKKQTNKQTNKEASCSGRVEERKDVGGWVCVWGGGGGRGGDQYAVLPQ